MSSKVPEYELLLAEYCSRERIITLLREYRPYLEMLPSLRRPQESVITIPLPIIKIRCPRNQTTEENQASRSPGVIQLPCDLAVLMCDPEWKIKLGVEILVFIHRPEEEFSELLGRWRKTQVFLEREYEWLMPLREEHIFSDKAERILPLFIIFQHSPERIKKGLINAGLPCLIQQPTLMTEERVEIIADC
jgi:hypothetical protein